MIAKTVFFNKERSFFLFRNNNYTYLMVVILSKNFYYGQKRSLLFREGC